MLSGASVATLNEGSLWVVFYSLIKIHDKWRGIGLGLNLQPSQLGAIGKTSSNSLECLYKVVMEWLNRSNPLPTWDALVAVLRTSLVGENELANTLHEKFCSEVSIPPHAFSKHLEPKAGECVCVCGAYILL